ncbi:MAG TPA: ABC-F family ATP-binding cassette domain-containing protein [Gemmatimonadales bacterium]|nr:ABC-F family ATP-binding cassette domain-containing protein [Gemmatimonadales bacterium]
MTQISFGGVGIDFGATTLFSDVTFTVAPGERWGIVGRNGAGKTTLFRLLTGDLEPSRGSIARAPGLRVSLLEQHRDFGDAATVWTAAAGGLADLLELEQALVEQAAQLAHDSSPQALARYGENLERFERDGGYAVTSRIDTVLQGLEFDPAQARVTPLSALSGGELGRLGLARQLMSTADVLLLDEPTNHLDLETTRWLEQYLADSDRTVLLVSHDRAFLAATVDHILHFEGDTATAYTGGYAAFVAQRAERRLAQQRAYEQQQRVIAHEQDYIARNIAGQNSRQAKGRRTRLERLPRLSPVTSADGAMALRFEVAERGGDQVVIAKNVSVGVGSRTLIERFNGTLDRGGVLGILGPNGSGKSTLLAALLGEHPTESGELRLGASITAGYYRQDLSQVPLDKVLYDVIADLRPLWERGRVQGHLGRFGFSGKEVLRRADSLSGGERARLALAILMLSRANLLVLDEPTNHLDVESIEALEDAIEAYDGTVILVSHDRELLRALTTRVWVVHDRHLTEYAGGFAEWEEVSAERAHAAAVRAAEDRALRQVHEHQRVAVKPSDDPRKALRRAQQDLAAAEAAVAELESQVAPVVAALEDPALYTRPDGATTARQLGVQLETLKRKLDAALERWTQATERVERLGEEGREKGKLRVHPTTEQP